MSRAAFGVVVCDGPQSFLHRAERFLLEAEAENNLVLGIALELAQGAAPGVGEDDPPWFAVAEDSGGTVVGAAFRTPPHKVCLTRMPAGAAGAVGEAAADRWRTLPGFLGTEEAATAAARAWAARHGGTPTAGMRQRMHRLDAVTPPGGVRGRWRRAVAADLERALAWGEGFAREAGAHFRPPAEAVRSWIEAGLLFLWESDAEPVSMAVARGGTPRGVRIGYVYTPPEHRGRGYATALVAGVSRRMLDEGYRFCVLYTDLANPTSNAIYARVGYRPVCDVMDVEIR